MKRLIAAALSLLVLAALQASTLDPHERGRGRTNLGLPVSIPAGHSQPERESTGAISRGPHTLDPRVGREGDIAAAPRVGWATYCAPTPRYCQSWGDGAYLGAVRSFSYGDDPYWLQVCRADRPSTCTHVLIVSFCACGDRRGEPTLVDLSPAAFRELAPLSAGVVRVIVDRGAAPRITTPPTDSTSTEGGQP